MLSVWKAWLSNNMFEHPFSRLEPEFLILGLGTDFSMEAAESRRNGLFYRRSRRRERGGPLELRTEMEMVSPGTISPKAPESHFASMKIFMPRMPSVFVLFSVGKFPFPLALNMAMRIVMLSFWEPIPNMFECSLLGLEPGLFFLVSGTKFSREAYFRSRNGLFSMFSRTGEGGWPWELRTEMEMFSMATMSPEVPEFHFASMRIFRPLIPSVAVVYSSGKLPFPLALTMATGIIMLSFWEAFPKRLECSLSQFEPGFLVLRSVTEFPRVTSERRNELFFRRGGEGGP